MSQLLHMRAAYQACARVGVEPDYCEHQITVIDGQLRAYLAHRA